MLCVHLRVFKVDSNQILSEISKSDISLSLFKCFVISKPGVAISEFPESLCELEPRLTGKERFFFVAMYIVYNLFSKLIDLFCELIRWLICDKTLISWLSESVRQQEYIAFGNAKYLPFTLGLMPPHLQQTIWETLYCLMQRIFINLDAVHDNIDLGFLINLLPDLHHAISRKLDGVFHILVHFSLVTYKDDMGHA